MQNKKENLKIKMQNKIYAHLSNSDQTSGQGAPVDHYSLFFFSKKRDANTRHRLYLASRFLTSFAGDSARAHSTDSTIAPPPTKPAIIFFNELFFFFFISSGGWGKIKL